MKTISTSPTGKVMSLAIGRIDESTTGTSLAGIPGINSKHIEAIIFSFVPDKFFKLIKSPSVHIGTLLLAKPFPITDFFQFFHCNCRVSRLDSKLNNFLANRMIDISHKPCFSSRQPFQHPSNAPGITLCLFLLETCTVLCKSVAKMFNVSPSKETGTLSIGGSRKVIDSSIYSYHRVIGFGDRFDFTLKGNGKENFLIANEKAAIPKIPLG